MGLSLIGTLPVAALNIGLVAGIGALSLQVTTIGTETVRLLAQIPGQVVMKATPPNLAGLALGITTQIAALPTMLNPVVFAGLSANVNASATIDLGIVTALLEIVEPLTLSFSAGLDAPGLSAWSYAGRAASFGDRMAQQTATGWGGITADRPVQGIVLATESQASWQSFGLTFNTGPSARTTASTNRAELSYLGVLSGGGLNTGLLSLKLMIDNFFEGLRGLQASILAQIQVSLGLNLPDPQALINILINIDPLAILEAFVSISVNILFEVDILLRKIDVLLEAIANVTLSLSGGGLSVWAYDGPASGLGTGLQGALAGGLPGANGPDAPAYGMVIATALPSAWASFGLIFGGT